MFLYQEGPAGENQGVRRLPDTASGLKHNRPLPPVRGALGVIGACGRAHPA